MIPQPAGNPAPPDQQEVPVATVNFNVAPMPCQYDISLTEAEDSDGKKVVFMILGISTVNGSQLYWFPVDALPEFSAEIQQATAIAMQKHAANNPLVVANKTQMAAALKNMKLTSRDLLKPPGSN